MSGDTKAQVRDRYRAMLRAMSPEDRLAAASGMFGTARALAVAGLAGEDNPNEHSLRARLFLRLYGRDYDRVEREKVVALLDRLTT